MKTHTLKVSVLLTFFFLGINASQGQYLEMGIKGGTVLYDGDLNTNLFITNLTNSRWAYAGFVKYNFKKYYGIQVNFMRGELQGEDSKSLLGWQITRNLDFHSPISEVSLMFEIHLSKLSKKNYRLRKFNPYSFIGFGVFYFNPKTFYQGQEIELQSLGTEGQGISGFPAKYEKFSYSIPFGLGLKYPLTKNIFIGLEISTRWTLTDYIDDISQFYLDYDFLKENNGQLAADLSNRSGELAGETRKDLTGINRGNNSNDSFYTAMVNLSFRFSERGKGKGIFRKKGVGCYEF